MGGMRTPIHAKPHQSQAYSHEEAPSESRAKTKQVQGARLYGIARVLRMGQ